MVKKRRSPCPVACTLDLLGDKWTLLVIRDLFCGKTLYKEFAASPERIATNILADRLKKLTEAKLVNRTVVGEQPTYQLTEKGKSLFPVLQAVAEWGLANIQGTEARMKPLPL